MSHPVDGNCLQHSCLSAVQHLRDCRDLLPASNPQNNHRAHDPTCCLRFPPPVTKQTTVNIPSPLVRTMPRHLSPIVGSRRPAAPSAISGRHRVLSTTDTARPGLTRRCNTPRLELARLDSTRLDSARLGSARFASACRGSQAVSGPGGTYRPPGPCPGLVCCPSVDPR